MTAGNPRVVRRSIHRLTGILLAHSMVGCSINGWGVPGTVRVDEFQNESARVVSVNAWGLHISTHSADAGLTLGRARSLYVYGEKGEVDGGVCVDEWLTATGDVHRVASSQPTSVSAGGNEKLVASSGQWTGVAVHANQHKVGLTAGVSARNMLVVDKNFNGVIYLRLVGDPGQCKIYFKESK